MKLDNNVHLTSITNVNLSQKFISVLRKTVGETNFASCRTSKVYMEQRWIRFVWKWGVPTIHGLKARVPFIFLWPYYLFMISLSYITQNSHCPSMINALPSP